MATVVVNRPDLIEFKNVTASCPAPDVPTLTGQAGVWDAGDHKETGIVVDISGVEAPLLTPADARKFAKWLNRAADELEGPKPDKKNRPRRHYEDEDDGY